MSNVADRSGVIRFQLDGETVELENVDPTRTVLQYLREDRRRTGSKEGCAEGDCGACTVVIVDADAKGGSRFRAINSCIQFLPTLHGKQLITVESLRAGGANLNRVQQAMVDNHGSQCGFCTPGFVMSLFALAQVNPRPTRVEVDDALAGNLCRCTGYRPIADAAAAMGGLPDNDAVSVDTAALRALDRGESLHILNGRRQFFSPTEPDELSELLAAHPDATVLAGGTDVGLWVTKQHRDLQTVIYIGRVTALSQITQSDTHLEIGAAVPLTDAMVEIIARYPQVSDLLRRFASPPIRNAGTLVGNVANGSPIGDSMPLLMAIGSTVTLRSSNGVRELSLEDFYIDYQVKDLAAGEWVESVRLPLPTDNVVVHSHKLSKRFDQDISAVCTAYQLTLDGDRVANFRMACGGLAATIKRASHCEAALVGATWNAETIESAMAALAEDFAPISDMRASADYRLKATQNLLKRFYLETTGQLQDSVYNYGR